MTQVVSLTKEQKAVVERVRARLERQGLRVSEERFYQLLLGVASRLSEDEMVLLIETATKARGSGENQKGNPSEH